MMARITYDMALDRAQFRHWLPGALGGLAWREEADGRFVTADGRLAIALADLPPRRLGLLQLPMTRVTLDFAGYGERERAAFLARFDAAFRRGGG